MLGKAVDLPESRRASGRDYLPLVGGPNRKSSNGRRKPRGCTCPPQFPGLYLRQKAAGAPCDKKADRPEPQQSWRKPPRPQRKAACSGKAAVEQQKG